MKIVVATPLYPPDIAESALYVKELAKRFAQTDELTIVTYAHLPENVPGTHIVVVEKRLPLLLRISILTWKLFIACWSAEVLYAQNGASVELPVGLVAFLLRKPLVFCVSDIAAHTHAKENSAYGSIERFASSLAQRVVTEIPLPRPEILPFVPYPAIAFDAYEASWQEHLATLRDTFTYATRR